MAYQKRGGTAFTLQHDLHTFSNRACCTTINHIDVFIENESPRSNRRNVISTILPARKIRSFLCFLRECTFLGIIMNKLYLRRRSLQSTLALSRIKLFSIYVLRSFVEDISDLVTPREIILLQDFAIGNFYLRVLGM